MNTIIMDYNHYPGEYKMKSNDDDDDDDDGSSVVARWHFIQHSAHWKQIQGSFTPSLDDPVPGF